MADRKPKEIKVSQYWCPGNGMMYNRDHLPHDHPEQMYNYIKRNFNVNPADYGVPHPLVERFKDQTREELIEQIISLEKLIGNAEAELAFGQW